MVEKKAKDKKVRDPLAELDVLEYNVPLIETEKDPLDLIEQKNMEDIPTYDSESGFIIKTEDKKDESEDLIEHAIEPKVVDDISLLDNSIDDIAIKEDELIQAEMILEELENASPISDDQKSLKTGNTDEIGIDTPINKPGEDEITQAKMIIEELENSSPISDDEKSLKSESNDKISVDASVDNLEKEDNIGIVNKKVNNDKTGTTHIINEVKVDEDGVPLLNQFDSEKIKNLKIFKKANYKLWKTISIIIGFILICYGTYQAFNDSVKISDSVMYGEHETIAIAFIAIGILIILLSFYTKIMNYFGFNHSYEIHESKTDDDEVDDK